jgi:putative transposase
MLRLFRITDAFNVNKRQLAVRLSTTISACIRPGTPLSLEDARRLVKGYVEHYNNVLVSTAPSATPKDMLAGHQQEIQAERDRKLETAREQRGNRRH